MSLDWTSTRTIHLRNHPGTRRRKAGPEQNAQRRGPRLPQTIPGGTGGHGGHHQHRTPLPEAHRGGIRRARLPPEEDKDHRGGPHQDGQGRLHGPCGAAQVEQPPPELRAPAGHRGAPGEGAAKVVPRRAADQVEDQDTQRPHLRGSQASCGVRIVHPDGEGVAPGARPGAGGQLSADDGAPQNRDPSAIPGDEAHRGRRRGRPAPHEHPRSRLLHRPPGEGRDRGHRPVPFGGSAGELCGSGAVHPQQRRSHPSRADNQGGVKVAPVGDGGGCSCSLQV